MELQTIINAIQTSRQQTSRTTTTSEFSGLYCFFLAKHSSLGPFGTVGTPIYVGLSTKLSGRKLSQHLQTGATGASSFRRSAGALLKMELKLSAIPRGVNAPRDKYKFKIDGGGESRLTDWILQNTELGFWTANTKLTRSVLEPLETDVKKILRPTLDLEKKTRHLNVLADDLDALREICRLEAETS